MALKTANQMKSWTEWPRAYRMRDGHALAAFRAEHEEEIGFWKFCSMSLPSSGRS